MRREEAPPGHTKQEDQKGALEALLLSLYGHFIGREGVSDSSENFGHLYLVLGSCDSRRGLF